MYRVLIADDDILMREALNIMIAKDSAFKVVHMTGTGEGAVRACKEDVIDIVFMDMLDAGNDRPGSQQDYSPVKSGD
ncbi:MAG: response regulator transcription factor [Enterocloster bolteae]